MKAKNVCILIFATLYIVLCIAIDTTLFVMSYIRHENTSDQDRDPGRSHIKLLLILAGFNAFTTASFILGGIWQAIIRTRVCDLDSDDGCFPSCFCIMGLFVPFLASIAALVASFFWWKLYFVLLVIKWVPSVAVGCSLCCNTSACKGGGSTIRWQPTLDGKMIMTNAV